MPSNLQLPPDFPPIVVHRCEAARREPGYIIISVGMGIRAVSPSSAFEALVALDQEGNVAWYWCTGRSLMDVKYTSRGTLLVVTTDGCIQEIGFGGETIRKWFTRGRGVDAAADATLVETPYFHHAVSESPNGNLAALSIATQEFDNYPLSESEPSGALGRRLLVGDTLVEFQPDGSVRREHNFLEILDPRRFGYGLGAPFWSRVGVVPDGADWSHANGLAYDPTDDSFIVTIDRTSGELQWILGTPAGWRAPWSEKLLRPIGATSWHWHPHDPSLMSDGSILLFDNGESGAFPPDRKPDIDDCVSRAVAYRVDDAAMTVEQVWSFGGPAAGTPYSMYVSGAVELPQTGNIFVAFGGITLTKDSGARTNSPPLGHGSAELFEVTGDNTAEVLFHAEINNRETDDEAGWAVFRAEWVPAIGA